MSENDSSDNERYEELKEFKEDGYHPIHMGEILDNRYIVLKKMGWGHFSTVWLVFNIKDKRLYALKVMRSHPKYIQTGIDEEAINRIVADNYENP